MKQRDAIKQALVAYATDKRPIEEATDALMAELFPAGWQLAPMVPTPAMVAYSRGMCPRDAWCEMMRRIPDIPKREV